MSNIIDSIVNKDFVEADSILSETVELIMARKLEEAKKMTAAKICEQPYMMNRTAAELRRKDIVEEEEIEEQERPDIVLGQKAQNARNDADQSTEPWAKLVTDYGHNSNIGKAATSYKDNLNNKANKAEKDYADATKAHRKDVESQRVTNKLSYLAKQLPELRPEMEKLNWKSKAATYGGDYAKRHTSQTEPLKEEEQLDEARIKIVKARIRGGKIQRRKKVSNVPGMTIRGGKLTRMSPAERRRRKMGQRRGKIKRRAKMNRALMKRQRSIRKRRALGL